MAGKRNSKIADFFKTVLLLSILAVGSAWLAARSTIELAGLPQILDGDSLKLNGKEIRLWGIDAPEYDQICRSPDTGTNYQCGRKALQALRALVNQGIVTCDGWEHDKYDRLLSVCRAGGMELNETMVRRGWAVAFGGYEGAESSARAEKLGLWSGEFDSPSTWRRNRNDAHSANWLEKLRLW